MATASGLLKCYRTFMNGYVLYMVLSLQNTYMLGCEESAYRYHEFMADHPDAAGIPLTEARTPRQIERDERFWTITATKSVFDHQLRTNMLVQLLVRVFVYNPPIPDLPSWEDCLDGDLRLYFEACLSSPRSYVEWLRSNLQHHQMIPYVLDAAARENTRTLEEATHIDAVFINVTNGFAWVIEAKVLSDISYLISFDNFRNQIARNIDVMLDNTDVMFDNTSLSDTGLKKRDPDKSLFSLLTPLRFKQYPSSRLYGWLIREYKNNPNALKRDLPHRKKTNWADLLQRIGWVTFEDFQEILPGACPWL